MATVTHLDTGSVGLDRTYQRRTGAFPWAYGKVTASIAEETNTYIKITVNGALMYGGYENYIPWDVGVRQVFEDGTSNTQYISGAWTNTTQAQAGNYMWMQESTYTFQKESRKFGLLPFVKIGCIEYDVENLNSDYNKGNDWMFGGNSGILIGYNFSENVLKGTMTHTSSLNGFTKTIPAFIIFAGNNTTSPDYSNAKLIVDKMGLPMYVYNSAGVPKQVTSIYVYNSAGVPKKATGITVYNSSGVARTISC